ncbi:NADH-quinone oxidoreductase subunit NuoH [Salinispora mooreana]|uniref:NADH-quinone oxidoreductase subunit NuoH n=1 Tax=Salinispora mooreana TaxID=999545 RepID=UPI00035D5F87|nr:NADH-quinone oxidoreductase subunit NuoH [Salinispora mooreana]
MTFLAQEPTLADFGRDPWWLVLIKIVFAFAFGLLATLLGVWFERRVVGRMAVRPGPNQLGPFGLLQTLADGMKMAFKEDILPRSADKVVYFFAPVISVVCAVTALSVMPFGPMVSIFGHQTPLQVTDVSVAVLLVLACSSMAVYGVVLAGWASGSTYPLLGGLRSSAQLISYEIALGLSIVAVFMLSGTMSTSGIVAAQGERPQLEFFGFDVSAPGWYAILLFPSFVIFFIAIVGETNRAPFDLPEAESELVAGFMTEYSSLKFALIMLSEYVAMVTMSAFTVTLFLGGWRAPWPITAFWDGANSGWWPMLWFFGKVLLLVFVFVWLRGTLPRLRYDQFMRLGWKVLLPLNLVWILVLAGWLKTQGWEQADRLILYGAVAGVVLILTLLWPSRSPAPKPTLAEEINNRPPGSFPLPPLDLQVPLSPRTQRIVAEREPANLADTDSREV